jgi:hypothetical protein
MFVALECTHANVCCQLFTTVLALIVGVAYQGQSAHTGSTTSDHVVALLISADTQSSSGPIGILSRTAQLSIRTRASPVDLGGGSPSSSDSAGRPARNQEPLPVIAELL